jgi:hypothetical protein
MLWSQMAEIHEAIEGATILANQASYLFNGLCNGLNNNFY